MESTRIILIEDDSFTRATMKAALQLQGLDVIHDTATPSSALRIAANAKPDAAVIDLDLGIGPTGIDVALGLRRIVPTIGIVLLTGFSDPRLLNSKIAQLPSGSRYLVKSDVREIEILYREVLLSISISKSIGNSELKGSIPLPVKLPDAQIETLRLLAQGNSNSEIARTRGVSEKSVEQAISRLVSYFKITEVTSNKRVELARIYFKMSGSLHADRKND